MANNQIVISRIQNRRGIRENLPQPLLPGEFALTVDTGELWIGTDPNQPPFGVRTYGSGAGDISSAESIVDTQIASVVFSTLDETGFEQLVTYLRATPTPAVVLTDEDILWDGRLSVFIAADTSVDAANTISNIMTAVGNSPVSGGVVAQTYDALGALNDPSVDPSTTNAFDIVDGDFLFTISGSNAEQGANAATLINRIHGTQLVTTLANLQVTTTGVGVGTPAFQNWVLYDNEANLPVAATWLNASTPRTISADSVTDTMRVVAGEGISLDADVTEDYIRITNTYSDIPTNEFTLTGSTGAFTDITNLNFDIDAVSDVIFLDYSLNISGATANDANMTGGGQMVVVGSNNVGAGDATLTDTQVDVRDNLGDPNFSQVQFLASFDGADFAQVYTEQSQNALVGTFQTGSSRIRTVASNSPPSSYNNNSGTARLEFPNDAALQLGSSDFTIEFFIRAVAFTVGTQFIAGHYGTGGNQPWAVLASGTGANVIIRFNGATVATVATASTSMVIDTWYHVVLERTGSDWHFGLNGFREQSGVGGLVGAMQTSDEPLTWGGNFNSGPISFWNGYIDDARITQGSNRYDLASNATYTVPTTPFPTSAIIPYAGDINFQAAYVPGSPNKIQLQYTNTFPNDATLRVTRKRWQSF